MKKSFIYHSWSRNIGRFFKKFRRRFKRSIGNKQVALYDPTQPWVKRPKGSIDTEPHKDYRKMAQQ